MNDKELDTKKPLEGRVAQVLNERELVINIGATNGVQQGMKFAILSETPTQIRDPKTNEVLDVIDREKIRVEASEVRTKIAICKTYRTTIIKGRSFLFEYWNEMNMQPTREIPETLRANDSSFPPPLSPEESFIKVNDRVIQVKDVD